MQLLGLEKSEKKSTPMDSVTWSLIGMGNKPSAVRLHSRQLSARAIRIVMMLQKWNISFEDEITSVLTVQRDVEILEYDDRLV